MSRRCRFACLFLAALLGLTAASLASAAAPAVVLQAQGRMSSAGGGPVSDGVYPVLFRLYTSKDGGQALWTETWIGLPVSGGLFSAALGTVDATKNPLPANLFAENDELWLGVQVSIEAELPRVRLTPAAFAVRAQYANQLLGEVDGKQLAAGSVGEQAVGFNYAGSPSKGGPADDLACTGCVQLGELAPGVLAAGNVSWQQTTVASGLDGAWEGIGQLNTTVNGLKGLVQGGNGSVGVGKAPANTCSVDLAANPNGLCIDGQPATVVLQADSAAAMAKLAKPGQLVLRSDDGGLYLYTGSSWKKLQFTAVCGDNSVDPPETCDDGNASDTDACVKCQKAACGDGFVQAGVEGCDDGNADTSDACVKCQPATCGDGFIRNGVETCDGAQLAGASCASVLGVGHTGTLACAADCKSFNTTACVGPLGSQSNPAASCKALLTAAPTTASGAYWVKNGSDKVRAYCDMTTSGGGWTLVTSWNYSTVTQQWGTFTAAVADPKPGVKHALPFQTMFDKPAEFRMVYSNGQVVTAAMSGTWEKGGTGVRIKLTNGLYLIYDQQACAGGVDTPTGSGFCMVNGNYSDGFACDGNSGQNSGSGLFNACAGDENGCNSPSWVLGGGVQVCGATGLVAIYLR